jgi:hypothetical protein
MRSPHLRSLAAIVDAIGANLRDRLATGVQACVLEDQVARADDSLRVSEGGARINKLGKTAEPALKIPSAFQNPLTQTPDRHWYTHP